MKLAIVIPGFQSSEEDWCIPAFANLARQLSGCVELHVFTLRYPHRRDDYRIGQAHVHSLGGGAVSGVRLFGVSLLKLWDDFFKSIRQEHSKSPFDAIVGIWATESGWLSTRIARRLGVPCLVHLAGGELVHIPQIAYGNWANPIEGRMVRSTLRRADLLTSPSLAVRKRLTRTGADLNKACDWALGVDTSLFSPVTDQPDRSRPFTFVTAGSLIPVKGHRLLIRALAQLKAIDPDLPVRLRIVGDGPLRHALESLSSTYGLTGYVSFEGEVPHHVLPDVYRNSDAFLLSSYHEAQCMAVLEAMSCGLPWIGPPVGSLLDLSRQDERLSTGFIFRERNPRLVADLMHRLATMPAANRDQMSCAARARILEDYHLHQQTQRLLTLVQEIATQVDIAR
jgi:glycosyltransferase involved in cell wall biosynthesis